MEVKRKSGFLDGDTSKGSDIPGERRKKTRKYTWRYLKEKNWKQQHNYHMMSKRRSFA